MSGVHRNCDDSLRDLSINLVTLSEAKGLIFDDITPNFFILPLSVEGGLCASWQGRKFAASQKTPRKF